MINQQEWLQTRKNLLEQVKSQVQIRLGPPDQTLRRYAKSLETDFRGTWKVCLAKELNHALRKAQVILSADFHAYSQSQRAHVRLLRDHVGRNQVVLALECLRQQNDEDVAQFLAGRMSESKFLQQVEWEKFWGFPWENYRPLFELARDLGYSIRGLNQTRDDGLHKRDQWAAERILRLSREAPESLIFVVMGEWHLASTHLPRILSRRFKDPQSVVVLHQDAEQLYFRLAGRNKESSVEFLKASRNRFCFMVSPPWMKWQSYLMYLEQAYDRDLQESPAIDYSDHVLSLIHVLENDLKIELGKTQLQVYCPNSKAPLARLRLSLNAKQEKALLYHVANGHSFLVPPKGWVYLSRATINHASSLAGQVVHAQLCGRKRTLWNMPQDFLALVWIEAVGFFFSKWINPKRKAETLESVRLELAARHPKERGRKALLLALDHRLSEVLWVRTGRMRRAQFNPRQSSAYLDAARIVGSMLGERMFQKVRSRTISLTKLMSYLRVNVESKEFAKFYWQLIRDIEHDQSL